MMQRFLLVIILVIVLALGCISCHREIKQESVSTPRITVPTQIQLLIDWCQKNPKYIRKAFNENELFYAIAGPKPGVYAHNFGVIGDIRIPNTSYEGSFFKPTLSKKRDALYQIYTDQYGCHLLRINQSGHAKYLYTFDSNGDYYDVAPDESEIAYSKRVGPINQIFRYSLKNHTTLQFTLDSVGGMFPNYSDDGKKMAYCANRKLRVKDITTGQEEIIVNDSMLKEIPRWSPDGKWIVYQASVDAIKPYNIYKVNVQTREVFQLTNSPQMDAQPCFDKSGKQIIYVSGIRSDDNSFNPILWKMDADGKNQTSDPYSPNSVWFPCW
jgi:Tol biopolymer transport system component